MGDLVPIRRALLSVSDKTELIPFARALAAFGVELISTGGTSRALQEAGLDVTPVESLTGFPEMMDGRVKTLHPLIHGALLARRDEPSHVEAMRTHGITPIDLVCVNLYPFERTVSTQGIALTEAIEHIDIGGPTLIRASAKNAQWVTVVTNPRQYDRVVGELSSHQGSTALPLRRTLAAEAFARTASYDRSVVAYLSGTERAFPPILSLDYGLADELRYGENPHQSAAVYRDPTSTGPTVVNAEQLHGKHLSYNNFLDAAAALEAVKGLRRLGREVGRRRAAACIVKHTNPCGVAVGEQVSDAVEGAIAGDPVAAYGGILAVSRVLDEEAAECITEEGRFFEVVVAPDYEPMALATLKQRWRNVRILAVGERPAARQRKLEYRSIPGGMLVQDRDLLLPDPTGWAHTAGPAPTEEQLDAAAVLVLAGRALASNAVCIGGPDERYRNPARLFGAGAGQMDRVGCCEIAVRKAGDQARGSIAISDAFFPFADGPRVLIDAGVRCIVHPGGSKRDGETDAVCNAAGVTCLTTGIRRFRH